MALRVEACANAYWTPEEAFKAADHVLVPISKVAKAGRKVFKIIANAYELADSMLPSRAMYVKNFLKFFKLPLIPFKIANFAKTVFTAVQARDWSTALHLTLNAVSVIPSVVKAILLPYKYLATLGVVAKVQAFKVFNVLFWPFSVLRCALEAWDLGSQAKSFQVIQAGVKNLNNIETAYFELGRLKRLDFKVIREQLEVSKECKIAERIDALRTSLLNKEPGALKDTKEFYAKMRERAALMLSLNVVSLALTIASVALHALLFFTAIAPALLGLALGVIGLTAFGVWAGKYLFLNEEIFVQGNGRACLLLS